MEENNATAKISLAVRLYTIGLLFGFLGGVLALSSGDDAWGLIIGVFGFSWSSSWIYWSRSGKNVALTSYKEKLWSFNMKIAYFAGSSLILIIASIVFAGLVSHTFHLDADRLLLETVTFWNWIALLFAFFYLFMLVRAIMRIKKNLEPLFPKFLTLNPKP